MATNPNPENTSDETTPAISFLREMVEMRPGGEHRHEQEVAMKAVEEAINNNSHLLSQAGTGTGKSLSYLIPAVLSGQKIVVSTATKQLSEQVVDKDIPELNKALRAVGHEKARYALLKGRDNYLCERKYQEVKQMEEQAGAAPAQESLFEVDDEEANESLKKISDRQKEYQALYGWAERTTTGDRSHGPATSDEVWKNLSSTNAECPGKSSCPFGEVCFAEKARDQARVVDIVVTNHAIAGIDLVAEEPMLLGERDVYIFDELHELDSYLSSAWGTSISAKMIGDAANNGRKAAKTDKDCNDTADKIAQLSTAIDFALSSAEKGLIDHLDVNLEALLITAQDQLERLSLRLGYLEDGADDGSKTALKTAGNSINEVLSSLGVFMKYDPDENVRWFSKVKKGREDEEVTFMNCAPMRIGPRLMESLEARNATMIGTSATITVGGTFDSPIHDFALSEPLKTGDPREFKAVDAGTPFDFVKQGMLYIPRPGLFPAPTGSQAERKEHTEAVQEENFEFVQAAGGRSLLLMATSYSMVEMGKILRKRLGKRSKIKVLVQGEASNPQLVENFKDDETSVLIATMGMWHGLDVPGKSCSFVGIDKIPFTPFDDPLSKARQEYANKTGRNGFMDVYVATANVKLAQGVGRLVRSKTDRGVVAVYDTRLLSARYGSSMLRSLPPMGIYSDKSVVLGALKRVVAA